MARSFSNAKFLSALVVDGFSSTISRRGYAVGSQGVASSVVRGGGATNPRSVNMTKKNSGEEKVGSTFKVSWVPDPKTGVYGPENGAEKIDAAELRAALLKKH
ncbi:protein SENESCENCE-ASSOCIATED GENE 21, mitochondrial [Pyrus x bretschneideri]|uniref:protein SENESCENCE-ASSOCIATED GENE 21, mitochondrial n=1 Tax=Pyrus x bretschneideri TaxID=225117 RepID=UPI00202F5E4F|nr:protein SENESCENCE-ASSOCIATED GENE 21, mitochondrial [Pyrus x bretschneideri]